MTEKKEKKVVDWELIERLYRAGVMTVRQIAGEQGISHTAIQKRAKAEGWTRDLQERVQDKAKELVANAEVANSVATVSMATKQSEQQVVNVLAQKVADIDLADRADLQAGIDVIRGLTCELGELSRPEFKERLEWVGQVMDQSFETESGREVKDKVNELYMYIIGIQGRIKMVKDLAGAVGVYFPLRRKVVGLDVEKTESEIDTLLHRIKQEREARSA